MTTENVSRQMSPGHHSPLSRTVAVRMLRGGKPVEETEKESLELGGKTGTLGEAEAGARDET